MKERIIYLDAIRGWAIFIVVWVHSTWLMLGALHCELYSFAVVYPMPLFFSVSGYLRGRKGASVRLPWQRWIKMLAYLLVGSVGYALLFGVPISEMFGSRYYYWFFAALLLSELLAEPLLRFRPAGATVCAILLWGLFLAASTLIGHDRFGIPFADMEQYWLFYWLGVLMARIPRLRIILTSLPAAAAGAVVLAAALLTWQDAGTLYGLLGGLGGLSVTWWLFRRMEGRLGFAARLGRLSLGVFLLSYPVLRALAPLGALVPRAWVDSGWQWLTAFVVAMPLTLLMALCWKYLNLIVNRILHLHK